MKRLTLVLVVVALTMIALPAMADMLIDFEPSTYVSGVPLAGQQGWTTTWDAVWYVVAGSGWDVPADVGAAHVDWAAYAKKSIAGQTFSTSSTAVSVLTRVQDLGATNSNGMFFLENTAGNILAGIWMDNANKILILNAANTLWLNTGQTYTKGNLIGITITPDFNTHLWGMKFQDLTLGTTTIDYMGFDFMTSITAANAGGFVELGGQFAYYDNIAITTAVPEPSSLLALGTGFLGICGFAVRRRQ